MTVINRQDCVMDIKYRAGLVDEEHDYLLALTGKGNAPARCLKRANILLMSDNGQYQDQQVSASLNVVSVTIYRMKKWFVEEGLAAALK